MLLLKLAIIVIRELTLANKCPPKKAEHSGSVGRALDWGSKGCWFEPHHGRSHCVVSLNKTLYQQLSTGSIRKTCDMTEKLLTGM